MTTEEKTLDLTQILQEQSNVEEIVEENVDDGSAQKEAEEQAKKEAEEQAKKEAEEQAKKEAEEQAKKEAEEQAKKEAEEKKLDTTDVKKDWSYLYAIKRGKTELKDEDYNYIYSLLKPSEKKIIDNEGPFKILRIKNFISKDMLR